ncbi:alkylation response protein AidB-like acyl-CoA dehydrogenase [Caulobacter ginsengisoli]|uniref:Alkylation response protein AidB-like acyl-CoA dehydrogenase n=1 Tax=Caulobacter ginsengisoli TaxID=400775 RepID=A0ABU0IXK4_9CAUL|nr:acyl-CoA dehydrogenase family protein [Caulobacter ginsengisoli]MDQ0466734.1 alkylation response protein AidB-like acyl-CoA dehydrogenase [Caulobacter ginsengisoli]
MTDNQLRDEVRAWLADNWNPEERAGFLAKVVEARWAAPRWPVEWFGRGLDDTQARIIEREFAAVGAPGTAQDRTNLWANTVLAKGTEALKHQLVGRLLRNEVGMCLLYSEPGAGSDLAGIRTRADRSGDGWVVNGQKVWTSSAATADYGMLIARTDWDVPKHRGISFFFLPMKQPGVEVRPLRQITNEAHFNEVFITDAAVPPDNLLGREGEGWSVLQTALAYERSVMGEAARGPRSGAKEAGGAAPMVALAREAGVLADPLIRQDLARVTALRQLNALNTARAKADLGQGTSSSLMSLGKLAMSRILHEEARLRTAMLGAGSLLEGPDHPRAEDANFLSLNAYFTSIGGGTDQIQRNIIGERVLGLPKEPEVDRDVAFREVRGG